MSASQHTPRRPKSPSAKNTRVREQHLENTHKNLALPPHYRSRKDAVHSDTPPQEHEKKGLTRRKNRKQNATKPQYAAFKKGRSASAPHNAYDRVPEVLPKEGFDAYIAARGFVPELLEELGEAVLAVRGRLVLARRVYGAYPSAAKDSAAGANGAEENDAEENGVNTNGAGALGDAPTAAGAERFGVPPAWAQNVWYAPRWLPITSISNAAAQLRALQRNWHGHSIAHHRRTALIQDALPKMRCAPYVFGAPLPAAPLGGWTLWDADTILASPHTASPFPDGEVTFAENKTDPPGRAYLKLWEAFTLLQYYPRPGELCLDLGASPGGWTWVLGSLGARVFSIDKAPLAPQVSALPTVAHCLGSGFALDPRHVGAADWVFSDMICYPERLLELIHRWLELGQCRNFVCTLKFQADTDHATARAFAAIPHSRLMHLSCNKHELTWIQLAPPA